MSSPSSPALKVEVAGRRIEQRLAWLALATVPVAMGVAITVVGWGERLAWYVLFSALSGLVCALGLWGEGVLGGRRRILRIAQLSDGRWALTDARGVCYARLLPGSRAGRGWLWLCWAPLQAEGGSRRAMLLAGADLPADDLRRLQVHLRLNRLTEHSLRARRGAVAAAGEA